MLLISLLGAAMLVSGVTELKASDNYRSQKAAFYEADSGLQLSLVDFAADSAWAGSIVSSGTLPLTPKSPFPSSITINGQTIVPQLQGGEVVPGFYAFGGTIPLGNGTFFRELWLPATEYELANAKGSKIWAVFPLRSTGEAGLAEPSTQRLQADARAQIVRLSIWDNAIFSGAGPGGATVNGNVQVRGSVHILGDALFPTNVDWNGTAAILNHYFGASSNQNFGLDAVKLPPLPTRLINDQLVETLDAEVRVKYGQVTLDGTATLGEADQPFNNRKETLDGFYVEDGVVLQGSSAVYSDETGPYDVGQGVSFPTLNDPYLDPATNILYPTHRSFLTATALTLPVNEISDKTPAFKVQDSNGNSAQWDPKKGELRITGVLLVNGDLSLGRTGAKNDRIEYRGTATLYATNNVDIHADVLPTGDYLNSSGSGSTHNLGLIADHDMGIATGGGDSWIILMAALYAEDAIRVAKQTRVAGAMVANTFDLGTNVPRIFQVPRLAAMLPPGMPGADPLLFVSRAELRNWSQLR